MNNRRHIAAILILLALLVSRAAAPVHAEERPIQVQMLGGTRQVLPGEVTTIAFRVTNPQTERRHVAIDTILPKDWLLVLPLSDLELGPREEKMVLLHVRAGSRALPGTYELTLIITGDTTPRPIWREMVSVEVLPVYGLDLRLEGMPRLMQPGVAYAAGVVVSNLGNMPSTAQLDAGMSNWAAVEFAEAAPTLPAWETRHFGITITPHSTQRGGDRTFVVRARTNTLADPLQVTHTVLLVASVQAARVSAAYFPLEIGLGAIGGNRGSGGHFTLSGRGTLWEQGQHEVDFALRVPDNRRHTFGLRDEYRLRFRSDRVSFQLGDHTYALSPLTEVGQSGFGASGTVRLGDVTAGALYSRSRFGFFEDTQYGMHGGYNLGRSTVISLQFLGHEGLRPGRTVTMRAVTRVIAGTEIDAEVGRSGYGEQGSSDYHVKVGGRYSRLSYNARLARVGPNGLGLYRNTDLRDVHASVHPWKWLRLEGGWQDIAQQSNVFWLQRQSTYHAAAALHGRIAGRHLHLRLEWKDRDDNLLTNDAVQRRGLESARVQGGLKARPGGVEASVEIGRSIVGERATPFRTFTLNGHLNLARVQLNTAIIHRVGVQGYHTLWKNEWSLNAGVSGEIGRRTIAHVQGLLVHNRGDEPYRSLASARLTHTFPWGHEITVAGRYTAFQYPTFANRDVEYSLSYKVHVGVPIPSKRAGFDVAGRIYDGETGSPIAGVILHLGELVALSGTDGHFAFARVSDGTYLLEPNRASIGLDRILLQGRSIEVRVDRKEVTDLEIVVVRHATLSGRAIRYDEEPRRLGRPEAMPPIAVGGLQGLLMEITDGEERLQVVTDAQGRFHVTGLRPGSWTARVVSGEIPSNHRVAINSWSLELAPGTETQLEVEVLPRHRQLFIIERGAVQ